MSKSRSAVSQRPFGPACKTPDSDPPHADPVTVPAGKTAVPAFEFSQFDGSEPFQPQSADELFDQLSEYLLQYGSDVLDNLDDWEESNPDLLRLLTERGYVERDADGKWVVTPKAIRRTQSRALEELFHAIRKGSLGRHEVPQSGTGQVVQEVTKPYSFGDPLANLNLSETMRNALARDGQRLPISIREEDFVVHDTQHESSCATVVLVDMSGSMGRYGKFGQAKRVALALLGLVRAKYVADSLQIVGFYTYATALSERQLMNAAPKPVSIYDSRVALRINLDRPPAFVPEHFTNIHAGLQFARRLLKRSTAANRQIITITDGEPTAHVEGRDIRLIYPPSERTAAITLAEAKRCADEGIHMATFALIEDAFYYGLTNFVEEMAAVTGGMAATVDAHSMGEVVISSFVTGRKTRRRMR